MAVSEQLPDEPIFHFLQSAKMESEYVPMPDPTDKMRYVIAASSFCLRRGTTHAIAPGETERTCRKVGAHKKAAAREKTPAQAEYDRVYNRLKQQKSRGKISVDEWNALVVQALEVKDRAECGEISDVEMKEAFEGIGRK